MLFVSGLIFSLINFITIGSSEDNHEFISVINHRNLLSTTIDNCANIWTTEKLVGRCWGLTTSTEFKSIQKLPNDGKVTDSLGCKNLCCELGEECITWQYWEGRQICKIGGVVRLGKEGGGSPLWCEPLPPITWNGNKRLNRKKNKILKDVFCEWDTDELKSQCFGLGDERKNSTRIKLGINNGRRTASECAEACCRAPLCRLWQHNPERGCYFNKESIGEDVYCELQMVPYEGGRKKKK